MQKEDFIVIATKVSEGTAIDREKEIFLYHVNTFARENPEWQKLDDRTRQHIEAQVRSTIRTKIFAKPKVYRLWPKVYMLWPKVAGIAAAIAVIVLGIWFFSPIHQPDSNLNQASIQFTNDVIPGRNTATLSLANGETINLSDNKTGVIVGSDLRYNDGSMVANLSPSGRDAKGREGSNNSNPLSPQGGSLPEGERSKLQMLTASTPRGGTYQVTLPDGTRVWLNAASKISFPSQFTSTERKILLQGEAYFEVAKVIRLSPSGRDGRRPERVPFIVESNGQQVEVLGTHFNINAYPDETNTKTTLLEGSVRVAFLSASHSSLPRGERTLAREGNKNNSNIVLKPNQQSTITINKEIKVKDVNVNDVVAWKNGLFVFDQEPLESIMKQVARWYNVEVQYMDKTIANETFSGTVTRFTNISILLKRLEVTGNVKFKIEGRRIIMSR